MMSQVQRVGVAPDGLDARRMIHVRHRGYGRARHVQLVDAPEPLFLGRHLAAPVLPDVGHQQHVRRVAVEVEPLVHVLAEHARRERPEALPILDLEVHHRLHLRRAGVAQDAAAAERARPELHAPLVEADDLLRGQELRHDARQLLAADAPVGRLALAEEALDDRDRKRRAEIRPLHAVPIGRQVARCVRFAPRLVRHPGARALGRRARLAEIPMPQRQRDAHRTARVAGGGLDPDFLERAFPEQAPVGHAVERHAAGHRQVRHAGLGVRKPGQFQHRFVGEVLDRPRQVHLALRQVRLLFARRAAYRFGEAAAGHRESLAVIEVRLVQVNGPVVADAGDLLAQECQVARLTVRSEPHHLVFARIHLEAGEVGERAVEEAERIGEAKLLEEPQVGAAAGAERRRRPLADAVDGDDGRLLERRGVEGGGRVRLVVVAEHDLPRERLRQLPRGLRVVGLLEIRQFAPDRVANPELLLHPEGDGLDERAPALRGVVEIGVEQAVELGERLLVEADQRQVGRCEAGFAQAVAARVGGEPGVVLRPGEALLLRRGHDLAVDDEAGCRVVVEGRNPENGCHERRVPAA